MNTYQAKQIPLRSLLSKLGYEPQQEAGGELWYTSPFRQETKASFHIKIADNVWYDFGEGKGGTVIDFALRYFHVSTVADALRELDRFDGVGSISAALAAAPSRSPALAASTSSLTVSKIQPLENKALTEYLRERRIDAALAGEYLQEIYYTREGKRYFALAFANDSGGYELRNRYFKGSFGRKDITLIPGRENEAVTIFEGSMDFLSAIAYYGADRRKNPAIVLNSVAMLDRGLEAIARLGAQTVHLYLDHDAKGREITAAFQDKLTGLKVLDQSGIYAGHKDFNEFLQKQPQPVKQL